MTGEKLPSVTIEGAKIIFKNFEGREGPYNLKGDRNFTVVLPLDVGKELLDLGWNIKFKEREIEGEENGPPEAHLKVAVGYKNRPPRVVMMTSRNRTALTEDTVEILDWADIENVDMVLNPSFWENNGKNGYKAWLKSLFITVAEDDLEKKYAVNDLEE